MTAETLQQLSRILIAAGEAAQERHGGGVAHVLGAALRAAGIEAYRQAGGF